MLQCQSSQILHCSNSAHYIWKPSGCRLAPISRPTVAILKKLCGKSSIRGLVQSGQYNLFVRCDWFTAHFGMMRSTRCTYNVLSATLAVLLLYINFAEILSVKAADPDATVDVAPDANGTFVFRDVYANGDTTITNGGTRAALDIVKFPALTNLGITYVHFKMQPCGLNLPHTHPRATELLTMISGGPLQVGVVDTSGTSHIYILRAGDLVVFPKGLLHFQLNVGNEESFFISALNSENPGVLEAARTFLKLPTRAAAGALNQDVALVEKLKKGIFPYEVKLHELHKNAGCVPNQDITTSF